MIKTEDKRRMDLSPALFKIAECFCVYSLTDGFCTPRNKDNCQCWDKAKQMQEVTGFSANACAWILTNRGRIEQEANKK